MPASPAWSAKSARSTTASKRLQLAAESVGGDRLRVPPRREARRPARRQRRGDALADHRCAERTTRYSQPRPRRAGACARAGARRQSPTLDRGGLRCAGSYRSTCPAGRPTGCAGKTASRGLTGADTAPDAAARHRTARPWPPHRRRRRQGGARAGVVPGMTITRPGNSPPISQWSTPIPRPISMDCAGSRSGRAALFAHRRPRPARRAVDRHHRLRAAVRRRAPLLKDLHRRVAAAGYRVQIALADTAGCAHAVARHVPAGRPVIDRFRRPPQGDRAAADRGAAARCRTPSRPCASSASSGSSN
jgi:hypothetical protein